MTGVVVRRSSAVLVALAAASALAACSGDGLDAGAPDTSGSPRGAGAAETSPDDPETSDPQPTASPASSPTEVGLQTPEAVLAGYRAYWPTLRQALDADTVEEAHSLVDRVVVEGSEQEFQNYAFTEDVVNGEEVYNGIPQPGPAPTITFLEEGDLAVLEDCADLSSVSFGPAGAADLRQPPSGVPQLVNLRVEDGRWQVARLQPVEAPC